ncbi:lytic transglycosylase domain-containing protein [Paenibacillus sp.]|uniref:lytic transglycosylase domain-containing protein n=1 Tax=Paenibacillus sp. TaxID=58172 RepID=UPI002D748215|nr:lytic transglycosylase domain-containing protein [Paenibacillus sp.]HZG84668.1 lytic transglycosylase domain-containing protein [Paenibacillus sp.]
MQKTMELSSDFLYNRRIHGERRLNGMSMGMEAIDPKLISAWLRTQFISSTDVTSASLGGGQGAEGGADFAALLQLMTATSGNGTAVEEPSGSAAQFGLEALTASVPLGRYATAGESKPDTGVEEMIREASAAYGVDPSLVRAVVRVESGYDPNAVSPAGAKGLMQLMDATARSLGVTDSFDPVQNVNGGTRYLSYLLTKYNGSEAVALAAYNAGPGRIDRLGIKTDADLSMAMERLPKETQAYIRKVLDAKGV